jgi:hypothetical protein
MDKEEYQFFKSMGICTHCRKTKAEQGKTLCLACKMRNREYRAKQDKEKRREYDRKRIENARANGLCLACRTNPQQHKLICNRCYSTILRRKSKNTAVPRSERVSYGLCYICGKDELVKGKKVCASCYEVRYESISKIMYMSKEHKNENF